MERTCFNPFLFVVLRKGEISKNAELLDFLQFQKSDHRVKTLVDKYNPKKSSFKMKKWGEHEGLWSLKNEW